MSRIKYPAVFIAGAFLCWAVTALIQETERNITNKKIEEIYNTLAKSNQYQYCLGDTQMRNMHYIKPHKESYWFCPECGDLAKSFEDGEVVSIPTDRLRELRRQEGHVSPLNNQGQAPATQPVVTLTLNEELDSILFLLKSHQAHAYTNMYTAEIMYHNTKEHRHSQSGEHGKCPDCIDLRKKQLLQVEFISRKEYNTLLELEKERQTK